MTRNERERAQRSEPLVEHEPSGTHGPSLPSVLIICPHFPPLNRTAARRPYHLAGHLVEKGHMVSVITQEAATSDGWNAPLEGMRILRLPLTRIPSGSPWWQRCLLNIHWRLVTTAFRPLSDLIADLFLPLNRAERLDLRIGTVEQQLGRHDVVIATGPGWSMFEFGAQLSHAWDSTFLPDYRDPWSVDIPEVGLLLMSDHGKGLTSWLRKRRWRRLERRYTKNSRGITAATPTVLENALRVIGERPSTVIFNGHGRKDGPTLPAANNKFTVVYTGTAYWEQEWEILGDALTQLEKEHPRAVDDLRIVMVGATSSHAPTMARVQHIIDAHPCVTSLERMDRLSAIHWQSSADRLLHVGFKGKRGILPLKFLEYIHAGVPVIQVSTGRDIQEAIVERTRTGVVVPDASALSNLLLDGISRWRSGEQVPFEPDRSALEEFTWEHQMERWREFLLSVHHARRTRS